MTTGTWSTNDETIIAMVLKSGLRQFYFPPSVNQVKPHEWSFLKPVTTIDTIAPYSTGTIAIVLAGTTVTLTTGVWPSWAATHGSLVVDGTEYTIDSRTSDTEIELASAWTADTETAADYTLRHDGDYDLPDDFGGIEGHLICESENYKPEIVIVGEGRIRNMRQTNYTETTPFYAAIRPKAHEATTIGQRFEIIFYPVPDDVYTLSYVKRILPQMLVAETLIYPYGGAQHAETLRAACIAAAEEQQNSNLLDGRTSFTKKQLFEERLTASIAYDKQMNSIDYFGYNRDNSDIVHREGRDSVRKRGGDSWLVTYKGQT